MAITQFQIISFEQDYTLTPAKNDAMFVWLGREKCVGLESDLLTKEQQPKCTNEREQERDQERDQERR